MSGISSINSGVGKFIDKYATGFLAKEFEKGIKEPAKFAGKMMVTSIVTKDLVGCAMYTYQSANNKKIDKDKRQFVAALDFTNGIINVAGQILSFAVVDKFIIPKIYSRLFTGVVEKGGKDVYTKANSPYSKDSLHKTTLNVMQERAEKLKELGINPEEAMQHAKEMTDKVVAKLGHGSNKAKDLSGGLTLIVGAIATMAFIKRTITPLLATCLADKCQGWFGKGQKSDSKLSPAEVSSIYMDNRTQAKSVKA